MRAALSLSPILFLAVVAHAQATRDGQAAPLDNRIHIPLDRDWSFHLGPLDPAQAAGAAAPGDWQPVTLPHTWNALDGQDGGDNYRRTDGWYRRTIAVTPDLQGKRLYLRFEAVNRTADIYVNGKLLGSHAGGNSAFCLDATSALHPGDNLLAVRASNADRTLPPLTADFTFFGGIYRPAELIAVHPRHIALDDSASSGIYVTTPQISDAKATVHVRAEITNAIENTGQSGLRFEVLDAHQQVIASKIVPLNIGERSTSAFEADLDVPNPHRWNGRADPYLYQVRVSVLDFDVKDSLSQPFGIRTFSIDPQKGFLLNGHPYDLHGVNRHQDRPVKGWAISNADHLEDMALIKEMGCTAIRLAHYQHSQFFYDLCDKEGMIVWAEIPVVNRLGNAEFLDNARQQYTELIRQNFSHPSICFWSAGNEVDPRAVNVSPSDPVVTYYRGMRDLAHQLDPSRPSVAAWRERFFPPADATDLFGLNEYLGWYTAMDDLAGGDLETYINRHSQNGAAGKWAVTEYGAGASIYFHSEHPQRMDHSEEYQALLHENTWRVFKQHPEIWGKFIWNMFDFSADDRFEGDHAGRNDKGLVTYDRKVRKDAFYFYKASWSDEPTLQLVSKRFATRGIERILIKAYTNARSVSLTVNGISLGERQPDNATVLWDNVQLKPGPNQAVATATFADGRQLTDAATWTYTPGSPEEIYQAQDESMRAAYAQQGPPRSNSPRKPAPPRGN